MKTILKSFKVEQKDNKIYIIIITNNQKIQIEINDNFEERTMLKKIGHFMNIKYEIINLTKKE